MKTLESLELILYYRTYDYQYGNFARDISTEIIKMWKDGDLPMKCGKRWIAGFKIHGAFGGFRCRPILVGPKPPSYYRPEYAMTFYDHNVFCSGVPKYKQGLSEKEL